MNYIHEVFISYKWGNPRKPWVDNVFVPLLENALEEQLGVKDDKRIFKDSNEIVPGADLPLSLKDAIAHSRCMICVITLPYFLGSIWCPTEFSAMYFREETLRIRNEGNHTGLIFPVIFIDANAKQERDLNPICEYERLWKLISNISPLKLDQNKFNHTNKAFMQSSEYNELKNIIWAWVKDSIVPRIRSNVPAWNEKWITDEFLTEPYKDFKIRYLESMKPMSNPKI